MRSTLALPLMLSLCFCSVVACGDDGGGSANGPLDAVDAAASDEVREVPCTDESVSMLTLFDEPNPAEVINDPLDEGFQTQLDTTGGGMSPMLSYVYLKFGEKGLEPVAISDEEAFSSLDWDIAARRFVLRLNSGVSGPGRVRAARTKPGTQFASVKEVPNGLDYRVEEYFDQECNFVNDSSGIGSPGTALASFWSYMSCVQMTHNVYILELQSKRHVKLEVLGYYPPDRQKICDETGEVPLPTGAGDMRIKWAFVD